MIRAIRRVWPCISLPSPPLYRDDGNDDDNGGNDDDVGIGNNTIVDDDDDDENDIRVIQKHIIASNFRVYIRQTKHRKQAEICPGRK